MVITRAALCIFGIVTLIAITVPKADEPAAQRPSLSAADERLLDDLLKKFVVDPKGLQYVRVKTAQRDVWGASAEVWRHGWLSAGEGTNQWKVYFTDGAETSAPKADSVEKLDFVAECLKRYAAAEVKTPTNDDHDEVFRRMRRTAVGDLEVSDLVFAAWLHRLKQPTLAVRALEKARREAAERRSSRPSDEEDKESPDDRMIRQLKEDLAWTAFAGLVHAYMVRADGEAMAHGERLLRLYPEAVKKEYAQAETIVAELKRRKEKGTFGQEPPATWPDGFDTWEQAKKVAWLIDALDEVDARQWSQPGGVSLGMDRRVAALIEIGDPAVPALIDVIEKDARLTRSVHFWRDFDRSRTVLSVREAALTAVMSILRVRVFEPRSTGDNFTGRGSEEAAKVAKRLREYWDVYGKLPYDERMMKTLADPKASLEAVREAAHNLGSLGEKRTLATTIFGDWLGKREKRPSPAVAKFSKPTVAEAILAAMDRDLANHDAGARDHLYDYRRREIEESYLEPLVMLGDERIAEELARRYRAATGLRMRRKYASACHRLGDSEPLKAFARDVEKGELKLPGNNEPSMNERDQPGNVELYGIVATCASASLAECDRALYALANPGHPYYALVATQVRRAQPGPFSEEKAWLAHPFCLIILRALLDDKEPTGTTWKIEGDTLTSRREHGSSSQSVPDYLADPVVRREEAVESTCDEAAARLGELVLGVPFYSPLLKDAGDRMVTIKQRLDRYQEHMRILTATEAEALGLHLRNQVFVPDISPLSRPATAEDVDKGRAVFHLDGQGKTAKPKLPATATLRQDGQNRDASRVLVVQAEVGADGRIVYGIIGKEILRSATADELTDLKPIAEKNRGKVK